MKRALTIAALMTLAACGPKEDEGPSPEQKSIVQKAGAANGPAEMEQAASNAVVDSGSGGATTSSKPTAGFAFSATIALTVDLDAVDGLGNDLWPNATGLLDVDASGTVTGDAASGTADYTVVVTALSTCVFTNPNASSSATVPPGASLTLTQHLTWSWTDAQNWSVSSDATGSVTGVPVTIQKGPLLVDATVTRSRHSTWTFSQAGSVYSGSGTWTSLTTVELATGDVVVFDVQNPSLIYITVNGVTFGPYTTGEVWWIFGVWCV